MKISMRSFLYPVVVVLGAIFLTLATFIYQHDEWAVVGNGSNGSAEGYSFDRLPTAGFPVSYMHADAFSSPYGHIGFFHGIFSPIAFVIDVAIFSLLIDFIAYRSKKWMKS